MHQQSFRVAIVLGRYRLQRTLDLPNRAASTDHDRPHDLELISGAEDRVGSLRLIFAVVGFAPEQLEISVAGDQLSIRREQNGYGDPQGHLHRAIAKSSASSGRPGTTGYGRSIFGNAVRIELDGPSRSGCRTLESAASGRCLRDRKR